MTDMTMKCAMYRSLSCDWTSVFAMRDESYVIPGYVQISDAVTVTFPPLSNDDVIAGAVASLDETRKKTVEEFTQKLANIDEQRRQLLAISHQVPA